MHGVVEPSMDPDEVWEARVEEGTEVERFAAQLFRADDVEAPESEDGVTSSGLDAHARRTTAAIDGRRTIMQGWLVGQDLLAIADILEPIAAGWRLWEVKASTSEKPIHDWDLGFQWVVARRAGIDVQAVGLVLLNKDFVRGAGDPDPAFLLRTVDRTAAVKSLLPIVERELAGQLAVARSVEMPVERPSARCRGNRNARDGNRPSECGHLSRSGVCGRELPIHWVGSLPRLQGKKADTVFAMANPSIDLLDANDTSAKWTDDQMRCIRAVQSGASVVDAKKLSGMLADLRWPVTYLDFEFDPGMAVPRFPGCRPYDTLPFQFSMLVQAEVGVAPVEIDPFLHLDDSDPREQFARTLLDRLPAEGSIVAHHAQAEVGVIAQLAERLGGFLGERLSKLIPRFFDTEKLARAGYCHAAMEGSWSIKAIAPALLGQGYSDLAIQHGMAAVMAWKATIRERDPTRRERLRSELLAYCRRDTLLMHDILRQLRAIALPS